MVVQTMPSCQHLEMHCCTTTECVRWNTVNLPEPVQLAKGKL